MWQVPVLKIRHPHETRHGKSPSEEFGGFHDDIAAMALAQSEHRIIASECQSPTESGAPSACDGRIANQSSADQGVEASQQRRITVWVAKNDGLIAQFGMRQ